MVISGTVSSKYVIEKAADVAGGYVEKKENVVNLLKQQEGVASNQVMLRVRFAEVSRSALQELGARCSPTAPATTTGSAAPRRSSSRHRTSTRVRTDAAARRCVFSDFLNLFVFNSKDGVGAVVTRAAEQGAVPEPGRAEPDRAQRQGGQLPGRRRVSLSGRAGRRQRHVVHDQFKEYGVRLNFTPTVLGGDLINLKVTPEVSSLDFTNAIVLEGFRIPALTDAPHRDRSRAARRADVRDRRADEQHA